MSRPIFYGVGVGPGDPELVTLKALTTVLNSPVISFIANDKGLSQSRSIAAAAVTRMERMFTSTSEYIPFEEKVAIPVVMPMCENREVANRVYDEAAKAIVEVLDRGEDVVFLCEGDPLFFGSYAYLLERIEPYHTCQVVPGISSVHAATATILKPLTCLKDSFAVISGRHDDGKILETLQQFESVVIMKAGRSRARILSLLEQAGRCGDAHYLEYIGRDKERVVSDVETLDREAPGPYFSLFVVRREVRGQK